jgi:hypothetical protein
MWWQDAITVAVACLTMVSLITALVSAILVFEPAMAAHCEQCGRAMIDSHLDGSPTCLHCRHGHHHLLMSHPRNDRAARELTTTVRHV